MILLTSVVMFNPVTFGSTLDSTADTSAEAVDVFTLSITDNVNTDGLPLDISEIRINVSGTSTDNVRSNLSWRLNGPDLTDAGGTYDPVSQQVSFQTLAISVAEGGTEDYTLSVFYLDNSALVDQSSFILTLDPSEDYTVELSGSPIGSAASVSNTFTTEVVAVGLSISSDLSGVSVASGQPIEAGFTISAHDEFGNVDRDYGETLSFSTTSPGTLRNNSIDAVNGVATFDELEYVASSDNEVFELSVDDVSGRSFDFPAMSFSGLQSDIIATQISFVRAPEPISAPLGTPLVFTTQPIVHLVDRDRQLDTDFNENISFIRSGSSTDDTFVEFSASGDLNNSLAVLELPVVNGVLEFTDLSVNFCAGEFVNGNCTQMDSTIIGAFAGGNRDLGITFRRSPLIDFFGFHEDGQIVEASGVIEPVSIPTTANTITNAVPVFDFAIQDVGSDLRTLEVAQLNLDTHGSTIDPSRLEFLLSGPDVSNVVGSLSNGIVSFSGVGISVDDGASEIYTVSVYLTSSVGLSENQQLSLSINAASDLTIATPSSLADSASTSVASGGSFIEVQATQLAFTIEPGNVESGQVLSVTPQLTALDSFGNVDSDFNEIVTLTSSAPGRLINNSSSAIDGVASFPSLTYVATADQELVALVANDDDGVGANLPLANSASFLANVTATQLVFSQMPSPLSVQSGVATLLDSAPIILATNDLGIVDVDFSQTIRLFESSASQTPGTLEFSLNGSAASVLTLDAVAGIADFAGLSLTYTNGDPVSEETFSVAAIDGNGFFTAIQSSQFRSLGVNRDGSIGEGSSVVEGAVIPSTATDLPLSVEVLDFVIRDGGGGDLLPIEVTDIRVDLTDSSVPVEQLDFFLIGPDLTQPASGVVIGEQVMFSDLPISVAEGLEETYQINVSFNDATGLDEAQQLILHTDPAVDFTLSSSSSLLNLADTEIDNGVNGSFVEIIATQLAFRNLASTVISRVTISDFELVATDSFGNTDNDFNNALMVSISGSGTLTGASTVNAVSGIASFSGLTYAASQDGELFTLNGDEVASNGTLTETSEILSSDVVATRLVFEQAITPSTINVGIDATDNNLPYIGLDNLLVGVPVIAATDDNGIVDVDFSGEITLLNGINTSGSQTLLSASFDESFDSSQVIQSASVGVATFSELTLNYTPVTPSDSVRIDATSLGLTSALGVELVELNFQPVLFPNNNSFGPFNVSEDVPTRLDLSDLRIRDDNEDVVSFELSVSSGTLFAIDGDGTFDGVTITGSNGSLGNQTLNFEGRPTDLNNFFTVNRIEFLNPNNDNNNVTLVASINDGVLDGNQLSALVLVAGVNDAPQITGVPDTSVLQDQTYSFVPSATDADPNTQLTFSITNRPPWLVFDEQTGVLTGIPSNSDVGIYDNIIVSVSDDILISSLPAFSITVENVNDAPVISGVPITSIQEDDAYHFTPTVIDPDQGSQLTFSVQNLPIWASFNVATGEISGTPTVDHIGVFSNIIIAVSDSEISVSLPPFSISVLEVNDAPQISGAPASSVIVDSNYLFQPAVFDEESPQTLTFSVQNLPPWLTFDPQTGALSGVPTDQNIGVFSSIIISVADEQSTISLPAFSIEVVATNRSPVITGAPSLSINEGEAYQFVPTSNDPDGDNLIFSILNQPTWLNFDSSTGALTGVPSNDDVGIYSDIVVSASDGELVGSLPAFSITVVDVNTVPEISGNPPRRINSDSFYSFVPTSSDPDLNSELTFSVQNLPDWLSFDPQTGALSGRPGEANVGTFSGITISVSDGELSASLAPFSIRVDNANTPPQISGVPSARAIVGQSYRFRPSVFEADGTDVLVFTVTNLPEWLSFSSQTGTLTGTPNEEDIGVFNNIVITVTDGDEADSLPAFSIEVVASNRPPDVSGIAVTRIEEDNEYRFVPNASDPDGDELTFSIQNRPNWLEFSSSTGTLVGTPENDDVGLYSNIMISVSDGELSSSLAPFDIQVIGVNDAPMSEDINVTVEQGSEVQFAPLIEDEDSDNLNVEIVTFPANGNVIIENGLFIYTPNETFVGLDEFTYRSNDGELNSLAATVTIDVIGNNEGPAAVADVFVFEQNRTGIYLLDVLANDINRSGGELSVEGVSSQFGLVEIEDNVVILTLEANFVGQVNLTYSVVDSVNRRDSTQAVVSIENGVQNEAVTITVPDDLVVNATGLLTQVDLGVATAIDNQTNQPLPVSLVTPISAFEPGTHTVIWSATNRDGIEAFASQIVQVIPLVSISLDHDVLEGQTTIVEVFLNGESPSYPVSIPVSFGGTAVLGQDFSVDSEQIIIEQGTRGFIEITTLPDEVVESEQTVVVTLGNEANVGVNRRSEVRIVEQNMAPEIELAVFQAAQARLIVNQEEGFITVEASLSDVDGDTFILEWNAPQGIEDLNPEQRLFEFDPTQIEPGAYKISAQVTDGGSPNLSRSADVIIELRESVTLLGSDDADQDLISDVQEGIGDTDQDGIPDYLDRIEQCNVLPAQVDNQTTFLIEGEPGVCIRRGLSSTTSVTGGAQISDLELSSVIVEDVEAQNVGGIFDFVVNGLPVPGSTYRIVLPQILPIPADAQYRKLLSGQWINFVEDAQNRVYSALGENGICPPPGDNAYTPGLTEGHWCVQLQLEDGGPNDDDGIVNGSIVDPGGVGILPSNNQRPNAVDDFVLVLKDRETPILVLSNDTDVDDDRLTIVSASANLGRVEVSADNQRLLYTPGESFIGNDVIRYGISDGNGGTAAAQVQVEIVQNIAPVAMDDSAQTNHRTSIEINVLDNDVDAQGDSLVIDSAVAVVGQVLITEDQTLIYTPELQFDGEDTIMYTVSDGIDVSLAVVTITVQGNRTPVASNDNTTLRVGSSVTVNVLANDLDEDNDVLTVVEVTSVNGEVVINQDNTITFIPDSDFVGDKQIRYVVEDEFGATDEAIVNVSVLADESQTSNSTRGGSFSLYWLIVLIGAFGLRFGERVCWRNKQAVYLTSARYNQYR